MPLLKSHHIYLHIKDKGGPTLNKPVFLRGSTPTFLNVNMFLYCPLEGLSHSTHTIVALSLLSFPRVGYTAGIQARGALRG